MVAVPYSPDAKEALAQAFAVQREWDHRDLYPEHLAWGVVIVAPDLVKHPSKVRSALKRMVEKSDRLERGHRAGKYNWSGAAKEALTGAKEVTESAGSREVAPTDILRALASMESELGDLLRGFGVRADELTFADPASQTSPFIQLNDEDSEPYYVQIESQIRGAIAEGRLIPGEKLPTVRSLADELDLAPGTVARAYRTLQEDNVIVTERSKGTTVALPAFSSSGEQEEERVATLIGLLKPTAVAAYHLGSNLDELLKAARLAAEGVFE